MKKIMNIMFFTFISFFMITLLTSCDKHKHEYGEWIIIKEATLEKVGKKKQVCNTCGYENIVKIPKNKIYTISFDSNGGTPIESLKLETGKIISKPTDPIREGYNFIGWYLNDKQWNFMYNFVTKDMTLVAKWVEIDYTGLNIAGDVLLGIGTCKDVHIKIPDGITRIGSRAFDSCSNIESITIPNSVTSMGIYTFWECISLTNIIFENNSQLKNIGSYAFEHCESLESITIPSSVTIIEDFAFYRCSSLTNVTFEEGSQLEKIEKDAFALCINLTKIRIPDSVISMDYAILARCNSLESITLPKGITIINNRLLLDCTKLTSIEIPECVTSIGEWAFALTSITNIEIPKCVTSIGIGAFYGCTNLESVIIPEGVTTISHRMFYNCTNLKSIVLPKGVNLIISQAFDGCENLTMVFYTGTSNEWNKYNESYNSIFTSATIYFYSETKPTTSGNYWHYNDSGKPVVW